MTGSRRLFLTLALLVTVGGCSSWSEKPLTEQQAKEAQQEAEAHCKSRGYDFGSQEYEQCVEASIQESMANQ